MFLGSRFVDWFVVLHKIVVEFGYVEGMWTYPVRILSVGGGGW